MEAGVGAGPRTRKPGQLAHAENQLLSFPDFPGSLDRGAADFRRIPQKNLAGACVNSRMGVCPLRCAPLSAGLSPFPTLPQASLKGGGDGGVYLEAPHCRKFMPPLLSEGFVDRQR